MNGATQTFTVTNAADVPVVALSNARTITIAEDASVAGWPTTAFTIKKPSAKAPPIQFSVGSGYTFSRGTAYSPGDIAGYVRLPSGAASTLFQQDEA